MQEVIHRVMEAEGEAKRILQEAQAEADRLINEAHQQAKEREKTARSEVRQMVNTRIKEAEQAAETEKTAQLARTVEEIQSSIQIDDPLRLAAIEAVVSCVAGTPPSG